MNSKLLKKILSLVLMGVLVLSLSACGGKKGDEPKAEDPVSEDADEPETPAAEEPAPAEEAEPAEPEPVAGNEPLVFDGTRSYLSGLQIDTSLVDQRPVAVMVENTKACLQYRANLDKAAIVVECPAEGGITRYMGIYDDWEDLERIGNIRSCRTYYAEIAEEYDAIYVHWGQSPFAIPYLGENYVDDLNALSINEQGYKRSASSGFFRHPSGVQTEHNGFIDGAGIKKAVSEKGYSWTHKSAWQPHWQFMADGFVNFLDDGEDCAVVAPYYSNNEPYFIYNESDQKYYRYEFGAPEVDTISGEQYAVDNIVMEYADDVYYKEGGKDNKKGYLEFYLQGQGRGKFITKGKMVDITWTKPDYTGKTTFYMEDGSEIILNQGKTWFCLIENKYADDNKFYATEGDFH